MGKPRLRFLNFTIAAVACEKNIVKKVDKSAMLNSGSMLGKPLTHGGCPNKHDIWEN